MVNTSNEEISRDRIANSVWLYDDAHQLVKFLRRRVDDMTGLTADTAEPLQITNYDVGGFYIEHVDYVNVSKVW